MPSTNGTTDANLPAQPTRTVRRSRSIRRLLAAAGGAATLAAGVAAVGTSVPRHCQANGVYADKVCTPGALNPNVTQGNIEQTICVKGYTSTIRPPVSYTDPLKLELMRSYGLAGPASGYELDHLISLELGGNPTSIENLWPEAYTPTPGAHEKDRVENYLHDQVCSAKMSLAAAQRRIATDWRSVWDQLRS